jgi:hypothetical protein
MNKQKKRLFGESSVYENMDGANYLEMDLTVDMAPIVDLVSFLFTYLHFYFTPDF